MFFGITPELSRSKQNENIDCYFKWCLWSDSCGLLMFCIVDSAVFI